MDYFEMKEILERLNEKWGLDFVSATSGTCCNTCMEFEEDYMMEKWAECETFLIVKWFSDGMNYCGELEDCNTLYIRYCLGNYSMDVVCGDLQGELSGKYRVIQPVDTTGCIILEKL